MLVPAATKEISCVPPLPVKVTLPLWYCGLESLLPSDEKVPTTWPSTRTLKRATVAS